MGDLDTVSKYFSRDHLRSKACLEELTLSPLSSFLELTQGIIPTFEPAPNPGGSILPERLGEGKQPASQNAIPHQ